MGKRIAATDFDAILRERAGITLETAVTRILRVWARATPADVEAGATWYGADASAIVDSVAHAGGISRAHAAAVLSHLSPRTTWSRNVAAAHAVARAHATGEDRTLAGQNVGAIRANISRACAALDSTDPLETLNGPKTAAFARNLLGDRDAVTVDVWAARIALSPKWRRGQDDNAETVLGRAGVYGALAHAYRVAARRAGVDATTVQATTWVVVRNGRAA